VGADALIWARALARRDINPVKIISIGEVLWDVVGEVEHLGGAPFNFSAHLAKLEHQVSFISAVGTDARGDRILDSMSRVGLTTRYVRRIGELPTGTASVTLDALGQPHFVIHRPAAYDFPQLAESDFAELLSRPTDWIYFGTLQQMSAQARELTARLLNSNSRARRFYDINLRPDSWTPSLVKQSMARATVVKLNDTEVEEIAKIFGEPCTSLEEFCRGYSAKFGWESVCITRGVRGCALLIGEDYVEASGYPVTVADTVGAGDAFAAAFVHGFGKGWPARRIADFANRVGALVASRTGAIPPWTIEEADALRS
jgi:fructokinase